MSDRIDASEAIGILNRIRELEEGDVDDKHFALTKDGLQKVVDFTPEEIREYNFLVRRLEENYTRHLDVNELMDFYKLCMP